MLTDHVFTKTSQQVLEQFQSSGVGLDPKEVQERRRRFGLNSLPEAASINPLAIFLRQFKNLMMLILVVAAILSWYYAHYLDVGVIAFVIFINVIIGFIQEYRAERAIAALKNLVVLKAKVKRSDTVYEIPAQEIVPGDIILIEEGDRIPADARLLYIKNLQCMESMLTGESLPVDKTTDPFPAETPLAEQKNMVFSGTTVVSGSGEAVVVAIGSNTALGRIAKDLESIEDTSGKHFLDKNNELVTQMSLLALATAACTFFIGYFFRGFEFTQILVFTLAALVSAIPESLPVIIIVVLSISARRMATKKAIVRTLASTETLSVVDTIITDKTGTLTQNRMTVEEVKAEDREKVHQIARYCNNVRVDPQRSQNEAERYIGDPTEVAYFTQALNEEKEEVQKVNKVDDLPFDQSIKARGSIVEIGNKREVFAAGAPESLLEKSTHYRSRDGRVHLLTEHHKAVIAQEIELMTEAAMRTIGFAYKSFESTSRINLQTDDISNLIWTGAMGIIDPPRPESVRAVQIARKAGIRVIMATGDHPKTALAIAKNIGLAVNDTVYTGSEIADMSDENLLIAAKESSIFARMTPESKLRLAQVLQKSGHIIAMTGDGVNDAPALKGADIGISMGQNGTDVARESSDIILADDNFSTIIHAIEEGRTQFRNIRRTSFFLITTNLAQSVSLLTFLVLGLPLPLLPKQILWINLVGSGVTDVALATEPIHGDVLDAPPRDKNEKILNKSVLPMLFIITMLMTISAVLVYLVMSDSGETKARTAIFFLISFMQIINMFNVRSLRHSLFKIGVFSNRNVNIAFVASIVLLLSVIYVPSLAQIFEFTPLSPFEVVWLTAISMSVLLLGELLKKFTVSKKVSL